MILNIKSRYLDPSIKINSCVNNMNIKNIDETKYKTLVLEQRGMNLAFYKKGGQNQVELQKEPKTRKACQQRKKNFSFKYNWSLLNFNKPSKDRFLEMPRVLHLTWKYFTLSLEQRNRTPGREPEFAHFFRGTAGKRKERPSPSTSSLWKECAPLPRVLTGGSSGSD